MFIHKKIIFSLLILCLGTLACNLPSSTPATDVPADNSTATFTPIPAFTATATPIVEACKPNVITNTDANVRSGPGQVYSILGQLPQGSAANVAGKNAEGTWWYIEFPGGNGGYGWIAGSITTANCIPATLAVIAAPPTPIPPTATNTPIPSLTPTNTPLVLVPIIPPVLIFTLGDIELQDVFLSGSGEVVVRVAVSGTLSGNFKYSVYVDGNLQTTQTAALPAGSQAYYSGVVLPANIFLQTNSVQVIVDPANAISETNEGNNQKLVVCNNVSKSC